MRSTVSRPTAGRAGGGSTEVTVASRVVFIAEAVSDVLQIFYFKWSGGKRLFRKAPLHHHFEMIGWHETTVVMRFWLLAVVGAMLGVGLALKV